MTDRIQFRIAVTVYRCLLGTAPEYLSELFVPASTRSSRHCLRSSDSNKLVVPPVKLSTCGRRSFTASGPIVWNSLPEYLRDPTLSIDTFRRCLKTYSILIYTQRPSALESLWLHALYKFLIVIVIKTLNKKRSDKFLLTKMIRFWWLSDRFRRKIVEKIMSRL